LKVEKLRNYNLLVSLFLESGKELKVNITSPALMSLYTAWNPERN